MTVAQMIVQQAGPYGLLPGVILLAVAGLVLSIPVMVLLRCWSEGSVSGSTALAAIGGCFLLVFAILGPTTPATKLVLLVLMVGGGLALPFLSQHLDASSAVDLEARKEREYREALSHNPTNVAARAYLAESLATQGRLDEAIEELQTAVDASPRVTQQEARRLRELQTQRARLAAPPRFCPHCHEENGSTRRTCLACGGSLTHSQALKDDLRESRSRVMASLMPAIPLILAVIAVCSLLPSPLNALCGITAMVGALIWLWRVL
ncbi:MAG TPA: tetratricopeptide repeat protein [Armatimonadota bacterium]|jgi:hypothetical protein